MKVWRWIIASPVQPFSKESTESIHPFISCVTLQTAKESFCFLPFLPGETSLCCQRKWTRHVSIHIGSLNDNYVRSFRMNIPVFIARSSNVSSEWRIFFPPLRDRLLRQFGISASLSLKAMRMVHIETSILTAPFAIIEKAWVTFFTELVTPYKPAL